MLLNVLFRRLLNNTKSGRINRIRVDPIIGDVDLIGMADRQPKIRVLFVCMANICRSPTARGVFEKLIQEAGLTHAIEADSAGTYTYQIGKPPDPRAVAAASRRGYDLSRQRARRIDARDFKRFDYILAMDHENLRTMQEMSMPGSEGKLKLFMDFARTPGHPEVPDPYYGGSGGFERVLDLIENAAYGLLEHIRTQHRL
jgi:protein-tyrosine phosphatase